MSAVIIALGFVIMSSMFGGWYDNHVNEPIIVNHIIPTYYVVDYCNGVNGTYPTIEVTEEDYSMNITSYRCKP